MRWASLDLTRPNDGRALPRLPHIAMFPPGSVAVPACPPAPTPGIPPTPVPTATPVPPPASGPPALDTRLGRKWRYVLKFDLPSRIATMKNALGDSVKIIPSYVPPAFPADAAGVVSAEGRALMRGAWATATADAIVRVSSSLDTNKWLEPPPYSGTFEQTELNPDCNPGPGIRTGCTTWEFELDYTASGPDGKPDPGPPFDAIADWATGRPAAGVGTWNEEDPSNIIGVSREKINWGLLAYSNTALDTCTDYNTTTSNLLITAIEPRGTDVSGILSSMRLARDGGVVVGGGTPTVAALNRAQQLLVDTFAKDPLYNCLRNYGIILVTDGESNICNGTTDATVQRPWPSPPPPGAGTCPDDWENFPPRITDDIWNLNLTTPCVGKTPRAEPINPRSWVIGFGSEVGKCELNYTAYKGRTDASSPLPDTGFDWLADPRLCATKDAAGNCTSSVYDDSQDYAFFADDAGKLVKAFTAITNAAATGDYATGAPLTGGSAGYGNMVFLSSTSFPSWEGHLYKLDTNLIDKDTGARLPGYRVWDAAVLLAARDASTRRIYTWNPSTLNLVEVKAAALGTLQTIDPSVTAEVVDFIRGNDGTVTNTPRQQRLGPLINTIPTIIAGPVEYRQANLGGDHSTFEKTYGSGKRRPMIWVGSNDGMLHAFDFETGEEILALMPPKLLGNQVTLLQNFNDADKKGTGQPDGFENIWGVGGSLRAGDVYFPGTGWRTVGLMTLADGGDFLAAIDITHPFPGDTSVDPVLNPDPNYGTFPRLGDLADAPVQVIWQKTSTDLPGLGPTWSLPALAPRSSGSWSILFGAGYNPASVWNDQKVPRVFQLNPVDGSPVGTTVTYRDLALDGSRTPWVGNQAFADGVFFEIYSSTYASDNIATRGLQADLNGRIWFTDPNDISSPAPMIGIDASAVAGQSQPIYYPPAAGGLGYPAESAGCNVYSFGSGTFYEESTRVNGPATGTAAGFVPSLYFAANDKSKAGSKILDSKVLRIPINEILRPESTETLDRRSQMTGAPLLLIDPKGIQPNVAIFVVYDPTVGCNGASYTVRVRWSADSCTAPLTVSEGTSGATGKPGGAIVETAFAGAGAASGFTSVGDQVFSGIAGLGVGGQADLAAVAQPSALGTGATFRPVWWKELK